MRSRSHAKLLNMLLAVSAALFVMAPAEAGAKPPSNFTIANNQYHSVHRIYPPEWYFYADGALIWEGGGRPPLSTGCRTQLADGSLLLCEMILSGPTTAGTPTIPNIGIHPCHFPGGTGSGRLVFRSGFQIVSDVKLSGLSFEPRPFIPTEPSRSSQLVYTTTTMTGTWTDGADTGDFTMRMTLESADGNGCDWMAGTNDGRTDTRVAAASGILRADG